MTWFSISDDVNYGPVFTRDSRVFERAIQLLARFICSHHSIHSHALQHSSEQRSHHSFNWFMSWLTHLVYSLVEWLEFIHAANANKGNNRKSCHNWKHALRPVICIHAETRLLGIIAKVVITGNTPFDQLFVFTL